jgi:hypothetical protein
VGNALWHVSRTNQNNPRDSELENLRRIANARCADLYSFFATISAIGSLQSTKQSERRACQ